MSTFPCCHGFHDIDHAVKKVKETVSYERDKRTNVTDFYHQREGTDGVNIPILPALPVHCCPAHDFTYRLGISETILLGRYSSYSYSFCFLLMTFDDAYAVPSSKISRFPRVFYSVASFTLHALLPSYITFPSAHFTPIKAPCLAKKLVSDLSLNSRSKSSWSTVARYGNA